MDEFEKRCPNLSACLFFNQLHLPATAEILKSSYCYCDYERCARFKMKAKGEKVPDSLWPDGKTDLAKKK
jgi:hypothetical protein